jgi:hypothetical protein
MERKIMTLEVISRECASADLDRGRVMSPETHVAREAIQERLRGFGYEVPEAIDPKSLTREQVQSRLDAIHRKATILFALWVEYQETGETAAELACACEFNESTAQARELDETFHLLDRTYLERLKTEIETELELEREHKHTRIERWADMLRRCANEHRHESAWQWSMLPVLKDQPYSRILLRAFPTHDPRYGTFLTQPFFLTRDSTLRHSHGVNWSFARPLGGDHNIHVNFQWRLGPEEEPCRCSLQNSTEYSSSDVVAIHPGTIHSIKKKLPDKEQMTQRLRVEDAIRTGEYERLERENRFGEMGCLHLYKPSWSHAEDAEKSSFLAEEPTFFKRFDMIVVDHKKNMAWAGGGGAWAQRMIEFTPAGGFCTVRWKEKENRESDLNPKELRKWLISEPQGPKIFRDG